MTTAYIGVQHIGMTLSIFPHITESCTPPELPDVIYYSIEELDLSHDMFTRFHHLSGLIQFKDIREYQEYMGLKSHIKAAISRMASSMRAS
jgi:hypothetical protein